MEKPVDGLIGMGINGFLETVPGINAECLRDVARTLIGGRGRHALPQSRNARSRNFLAIRFFLRSARRWRSCF